MTPQTLLATTGLAAFAASKFYFKRDAKTAAYHAAAVVAIVALFTARNTDRP